MEKLRVFKKYKNRHIYDLSLSRYVELSDIVNTVQQGADVKIVLSTNATDITFETLLAGLSSKESSTGNLELLKRIIVSESGTITDYISELENKFLTIESSQNFHGLR